jgi:site-specific recombinase XerD
MLQGEQLQRAYDDFINTYSARKKLDVKTVKNKRNALDKLISFLSGKRFDYNTANEYAEYMFAHGWKSANSQLNIIKNLRAFVNFLSEYDYVEKNFAKKIIRPKVFSEPEPLPDIDQAEAAILAGTEPGPNDSSYHRIRKAIKRLAMQFALRTGFRGDELIHIRGRDLFISDTDPKSSKVFIVAAKGGVPQWQPLPVDLLPELKKLVNEDRVFPVTAKPLNDALKVGAQRIGLSKDITMDVHILRKVFGTTLARYLTMSKVSRLMRHSDISITQKFYITYGISELGIDLNMNHPLIRIAIPAEENIRAFINDVCYPHFDRNKQITIGQKHDPNKRKFTIEISY